MKAWVLHNIDDFRLESVNKPDLRKQEVLVAVKAVGICGSDIPRVYKTGTYSYPLIPGHEFSGVVEESGMGTDALWKGKRVGVYPLIPCNTCLPCRKKQYEMCRHYSYLGSRRNGGFAEYVSVPADNLIELPDNVSFEEAAMLEPMSVAVHAIRRIAPAVTDTVAVCGLGTIGLLLYLFLEDARKQMQQEEGQAAGKILVIGNKDFQKQTLAEMGLPADCYCDSRKEDPAGWLSDRTDGAGADVFFECVGKNDTFKQAVNCTAPAGKVCLVGNPYSDMLLDKASYWKILRNQLTVTGTWNSSFLHEEADDWHYVLKVLSQRRIEPDRLISHRFLLEELEQGFHIMRDKTEDYVKIMGKNK